MPALLRATFPFLVLVALLSLGVPSAGSTPPPQARTWTRADSRSRDTMASHALTYFDMNGRGEFIRLAFVQGGVAFEDRYMAFPEFRKVKAEGSLPNGQLPILEIDGRVYPESNAILRYVGKLTGLYPEDPEQALKVDGVIDFIEGMFAPLAATIGRTRMGLPEFASEEEKLAVRTTIATDVLPGKLACLETILTENGTGWTVGDSVTVADFRAFSALTSLIAGRLDGIPTTILDGYPMAKGLIEKVRALPAISSWMTAEAARKAAKA